MQIHTRPIPCPKPVCASRAHALETGALVDGVEVGQLGLVAGGPHLPVALTDELLEIALEVPYGQGEKRGSVQRLRELGARAEDALGRAAEHYGEHFVGACMHGFAIDFAAALPRRAGDRAYRFVRLHCGSDETGALVATLGLPEQLPCGES